MEGGMEGGGGARSFVRLGEIGDYRKVEETVSTTQAALFSVLLILLSARIGNAGGPSLNAIFDQFGLESVVLLVAVLTILLQVTRYFYSAVYGGYGKPWSPFIFVCVAIAVQLIHDVLFKYGILNTVARGKNDLVDAVQAYVLDAKMVAFGANVSVIAVTAIIAMILHDIGDLEKYVFMALVTAGIIYTLSGVSAKPAPPPVAKPAAQEKKETMRDMRYGF
jgi:hypothetical protein